jgi:hypothetical protein
MRLPWAPAALIELDRSGQQLAATVCPTAQASAASNRRADAACGPFGRTHCPPRVANPLAVDERAPRGCSTVARPSWAAFARRGRCVTLSYVKSSTITIRLDQDLERELDRACARTGRTRSDLARDALRRQLALLRFERLRKRALPLAESQGYLTDDDVFRDVS